MKGGPSAAARRLLNMASFVSQAMCEGKVVGPIGNQSVGDRRSKVAFEMSAGTLSEKRNLVDEGFEIGAIERVGFRLLVFVFPEKSLYNSGFVEVKFEFFDPLRDLSEREVRELRFLSDSLLSIFRGV